MGDSHPNATACIHIYEVLDKTRNSVGKFVKTSNRLAPNRKGFCHVTFLYLPVFGVS